MTDEIYGIFLFCMEISFPEGNWWNKSYRKKTSKLRMNELKSKILIIVAVISSCCNLILRIERNKFFFYVCKTSTSIGVLFY